jgi:hypothetical protein
VLRKDERLHMDERHKDALVHMDVLHMGEQRGMGSWLHMGAQRHMGERHKDVLHMRDLNTFHRGELSKALLRRDVQP